MAAPVPPAEVFASARGFLVRTVALLQRYMGRGAYAVSADGAAVRMSDGAVVLDLGTWATSVLGHRPPQVVDAVKAQCDLLPNGVRGAANAVTPALAERLVRHAEPSRLERVWFGANGADAVEAALKLSRVATGRDRVLALRNGFHGRTLGALSISDGDRTRASLAHLLPGVTLVEREPGAVEREVARGDVAAVVLEVVQGGGPVRPLPAPLLTSFAAAARGAGAMVVVDEIQTGLWRCGTFSLALELGLDPDALLLGKVLGGGVVPLSAALLSRPLAAPQERNPFLHSHTFSGHPLACAAGLAALDLLPGLWRERSGRVTGWLAELRSELLRAAGDRIGVHLLGLMLSIEFPSEGEAEHFVLRAARAGVLLAPLDGHRFTVRVLAPLVLTDEQMALAGGTLLALVADAAPAPAGG